MTIDVVSMYPRSLPLGEEQEIDLRKAAKFPCCLDFFDDWKIEN